MSESDTQTPTAPLAERLRPVQDALAELEREYRRAADADNEPTAWRNWSDLNRALMSVRAAQGRDAGNCHR
ncbi:MAG: hypothetical protein GX537_06670 [Actinobacteria bacterium]|nr:hypothetical protein [Actinomycetota bacterium]